MKQFFVIGNKTSKSLSPLIFNHWFKKYNIQAKYSFVEVTRQNFEKTIIKKIRNKKVQGFNVTIPFKKDVKKFLDSKNKHAQNIGAVNCVTIGKKITGTNTDWIGYLNSIKKEKINKNKNILILGYGGASKAIYYGFSVKGYKNITVFNRSRKIIKLNGANKYTKKYSTIDRYLVGADLVINTTPTNPLNKKQTNLIRKTTVISDIVYTPKNTPFLKNFKGNKKIFGISMLLEQAVPCFYLWFGFNPKMDNALLKKIYKKTK